MKYEEALTWVHSLPRLAQRPGVENEKRLLAKLGHPERALKFAHIAGTNGKGSTSVMLASILRLAGYKTGLTVSPYVLDFRERFQIDGAMIGEEALAAILTRVRAAAEALRADGWDSLVEFGRRHGGGPFVVCAGAVRHRGAGDGPRRPARRNERRGKHACRVHHGHRDGSH